MQGFIQTVLLMSVLWTKIEFSNVLKCSWGPQGAESSQQIHSGTLVGVHGIKDFGLYTSGGQINSLRLKKPIKPIYFEHNNFNAKSWVWKLKEIEFFAPSYGSLNYLDKSLIYTHTIKNCKYLFVFLIYF